MQWVHVWEHKQRSMAAHSNMPFLHELDRILGPTDPSEACHRSCSTSRLPEPALGLTEQEDSAGEGPLGHQLQVLVHSPLSVTPNSLGSAVHPLPWLLWQHATDMEDKPGMAPALSSCSLFPEGTTV